MKNTEVVIYPHCKSLSHHGIQVIGGIRDCLGKDMQRGWCGRRNQGRWEGRQALPARNPVKLRDFAPRCLNVWQKTAKDHNRSRLPGTLGLVERRLVSEMRSLYMQWELTHVCFCTCWEYVPWYKDFNHVLRLQVNGIDKTWHETNVIESLVPSVVHLTRRGFTKSRCFKKNGQAFDYKRKL